VPDSSWSKQTNINILWHDLTETAHLEDQTCSEGIFVNKSIIEILMFICLSDVMAVLNNTAMECVCDVTLRRVRATNIVGTCRNYYIFWVCFIALGIQHAICMRHIILPPVSCSALTHFPTLYHKRHDFRGKQLLNTKWALICCRTYVCNIVYSKKNWARCDQNCLVVLV